MGQQGLLSSILSYWALEYTGRQNVSKITLLGKL